MNPLLFSIVKRVGEVALEHLKNASDERATAAMKAGQIPIVRDPPILMQHGEVCHFMDGRVTLYEPKLFTVVPGQRARTETRVLSDGFDFRPAFGSRAKHAPPTKMRVQIPKRAAITETQLVPRASGVLLVTSKRLVLLSVNGPTEFPLRSLIAVKALRDRLEIERVTKPQLSYFTGKHLDFGYLERLIRVLTQAKG